MNWLWSREQKWNPGSSEHSVYTHFPKDPKCDICLKTKITRASWRRRNNRRTVKVSGGDRRLKPSTLIRDRSERREEQEVLRGESYELSFPTPLQDDSTRDDAEVKNDFSSTTGDFSYRHHLEPRVKMYVPKEESFPIPMKHIDVCMDGEKDWWLLECRWREIYQMHRLVSQDSFYWMKGHLADIHGPVWD